MYFTFGSKALLENLITLTRSHKDFPIYSMSALESGFREYLGNRQPHVPIPAQKGTNFITDPVTIETLSGFYRIKSKLNDRNQESQILSFDESMIPKLNKVKEGFLFFCNQLPELGIIFNLHIHSLFCAPSRVAGGGSTSGAAGVIWCGVRNEWSKNDLAEFFVHELTHNLVFLDEHRHQHYKNYDEISDPKNFAWSAILGTSRPLDKVVHSIVVATEILQLRQNNLGHPKRPGLHPESPIIIKKTGLALDSIVDNPRIKNLLTDRGLEIINNCSVIISRFTEEFTKENKLDDHGSEAFRSISA